MCRFHKDRNLFVMMSCCQRFVVVRKHKRLSSCRLLARPQTTTNRQQIICCEESLQEVPYHTQRPPDLPNQLPFAIIAVMKLSCSTCSLVQLSLLASAANAWVVPRRATTTKTTTSTALQQVSRKQAWSAAAVTVTGWALATQIASAGMVPVAGACDTLPLLPATRVILLFFCPDDSSSHSMLYHSFHLPTNNK